MPDHNTLIAGAVAVTGLLGAVTGFLAEVRRWRGSRKASPSEPPVD
jgi:hypothetical protein